MKTSLALIATCCLLFSCGSSIDTETEKEQNSNEWTEKNRNKFLAKCESDLDSKLCLCILEKIIETNKNVVELGEMNQNEFLNLAEECNNR